MPATEPTQPGDSRSEPTVVPRSPRIEETYAQLQKLERRDWWLWLTALVVTQLLTAAVILVTLFGPSHPNDASFQETLHRHLGGLVGVVLLFNLHAIYQQISVKRLRRQLAQQMGTIVRLETHAEDLQTLASVDPLTELSNRRIADERLEAEVKRSRRHGHPLAVVMFDLNDFKQINDRYGHGAGDLVLKQFAGRLKKSLRTSDMAARLGGDEFLAVLPECQVGQADHVLARLGPMAIDFRGQKIPFTFSAGLAHYQSGESIQSLLERADQALYADKDVRKGRMRPDAPEPVPARDPEANS